MQIFTRLQDCVGTKNKPKTRNNALRREVDDTKFVVTVRKMALSK